MPDRYEDGVRELQTIAPPDQWAEIEARAADGMIVPLDRDGVDGRRPPRWPTLLAAAAALVLVVGGVTLVLTDDDDVRTTDPTMTTAPTQSRSTDRPDVLDTPEPTDATDTSELPPDTGGPTTSEEPATQAPTVGPPCPSTTTFETTTPPDQWSGTIVPAPEARDPRLPEVVSDAVWADVIGVFPGTTTTRAVFVFSGLPSLADDSFTRHPGPFGSEVAISPFPDGSYAEVIDVPGPSGACSITLIAVGMTEVDLLEFLSGLQVA